jgi:hypothetical protein
LKPGDVLSVRGFPKPAHEDERSDCVQLIQQRDRMFPPRAKAAGVGHAATALRKKAAKDGSPTNISNSKNYFY